MPIKLSLQIFVDKISGFCINVYGVVRVKSQSTDRKKNVVCSSGNDSIRSRKTNHNGVKIFFKSNWNFHAPSFSHLWDCEDLGIKNWNEIKEFRFRFKKVFASLCKPKKRQKKSSGTFVALLISLVLAWKLRKVAAQPRLVHKAKLTSRKLAISFLVTECVVLQMSVYGKKRMEEKGNWVIIMMFSPYFFLFFY